MVPTGNSSFAKEDDPSFNYSILAGRIEGQGSQNNMHPERYDIRTDQGFFQQQMCPYDFSSNNHAMTPNDNTFQYGFLETAAGQTQDFTSTRQFQPTQTQDYGKMQMIGNLAQANNVPTEPTTQG